MEKKASAEGIGHTSCVLARRASMGRYVKSHRGPAAGHKELFIFAAGPHPTAVLYGYIVEAMVPLIVEELKEWHGIDLDAEVGTDG